MRCLFILCLATSLFAACLGPESGAATLGQEETEVREAALASMLARWNRNAPNEAVSIELQTSPGVHPSAPTWIRGVLDGVRALARSGG